MIDRKAARNEKKLIFFLIRRKKQFVIFMSVRVTRLIDLSDYKFYIRIGRRWRRLIGRWRWWRWTIWSSRSTLAGTNCIVETAVHAIQELRRSGKKTHTHTHRKHSAKYQQKMSNTAYCTSLLLMPAIFELVRGQFLRKFTYADDLLL